MESELSRNHASGVLKFVGCRRMNRPDEQPEDLWTKPTKGLVSGDLNSYKQQNLVLLSTQDT